MRFSRYTTYDSLHFCGTDLTRNADITPELTVYRYSEAKVIEYLQAKVTRLSRHEVVEKSRTLIRNFAKDGLMDDGREKLLECR